MTQRVSIVIVIVAAIKRYIWKRRKFKSDKRNNKMKPQNNIFSRHVALFIVITQIFSTSITNVTGNSVIIPKIKQNSMPVPTTIDDGVAVFKNELHAAPNIDHNTQGNDHIFGKVKRFKGKETPIKNDKVYEEDEYIDIDSDVDTDEKDYNADYHQNIPQTFSNFNKQHYTMKIQETHEIRIKQGRIKGLVRTMHPQSGLKNVDQFLGIPYAEAPVGSRRFMPPGAPPLWTNVKLATKFAPVCPQNLPNINDPTNTLSKGRYDQIKRLLTYLKHEDEDCLYLNVYVPTWGEFFNLFF